MNLISWVGEKNGKINILSIFSAMQLCFGINLLNNKTITQLNVAEYPLILATKAYSLICLVSGNIPCDLQVNIIVKCLHRAKITNSSVWLVCAKIIYGNHTWKKTACSMLKFITTKKKEKITSGKIKNNSLHVRVPCGLFLCFFSCTDPLH